MNRRSFFGLLAAAFGAKKLPAVTTYLLHDPETGIKTTLSWKRSAADLQRMLNYQHSAQMEMLCALRRPIRFTAAPRKIGDTIQIQMPYRFAK